MTETTEQLMEQIQTLILALTAELAETYADVDVTLKVKASGDKLGER